MPCRRSGTPELAPGWSGRSDILTGEQTMRIKQGPSMDHNERVRGIAVIDLARQAQRGFDGLGHLQGFVNTLQELIEKNEWTDYAVQRPGQTMNETGELEPAYDHVHYETSEFEVF